MGKRKQRTETDFLCLTISAGGGKSTSGEHGTYNAYRVKVSSDATGATIYFDYGDSVYNARNGVDQLNREGLLFAFWSFVIDAQYGSEYGFGEFCDATGYDDDSITARRIYDACRAARKRFDRLFHDNREPGFVLELLAAEGIE